MREKILYFAITYQGEWYKITNAIKTNERWEPVSYQGHYITIDDPEYPEKLKRLACPPWILFYEGDIRLLKEIGCGIVGSRNASVEGIKNCSSITKTLKEKYVIISGMAKGIDAQAHYCALQRKTIGVIGCGLDVVYPKENVVLYQQMRKTQLLISEYPSGTKPLAYHFPWRNRIIAALSEAIIVVEARKRSGSLLTVNEALELSIPIYCVPYGYENEAGKGCNLLISQGAYILYDEEDLKYI